MFCLKLKSILSLTGWNTFHSTNITDLDPKSPSPLKYGMDGNHFRFWLYLAELYAVKGLHWSKEIHFNVFSKTSFSSCRNSALKRTFGAEQLEGRWVVGLLLPVPVHVRSWKSCTDSDFALSSLWIEAGRKGKPSAKKRVQASCKSLPARMKMVQLFHFGRGKLSAQPTKRTSEETVGKWLDFWSKKWYLCDKR